MGGRLADFLGQDLAANRPVAATVAGLTQPFSCALFFANDTKILSIYDDDAIDWLDIDVAAFASLSFAALPDVDFSTPPTDGQVFKWNTATSKLIPTTLLYNTAEELQDAVGAMFHNGAGITAAYNDGTGQIDIACTITQYTDELAQDAMGAAFAAGTHVGIAVNYNDLTNKFDLTVSAAYVTGGAVAAIAAASIADLADVHSIAGIANGDTLIWSTANSRFEPGAAAGYTNEQAQDTVAAMIAAGTHLGVTPTYSDGGNSMSFVGEVVFLGQTDIAVAAANADIALPAGYDSFYIEFYLKPVTDNVAFQGAVTDDNFASIKSGASDYAFTSHRASAASAGVASNAGAGASIIQWVTAQGNDVGEFNSGTIQIFNSKDAFPTMFHMHFNYYTTAGARGIAYDNAQYTPTTTLNGLRLNYSSGNLTGFYKVWARKG